MSKDLREAAEDIVALWVDGDNLTDRIEQSLREVRDEALKEGEKKGRGEALDEAAKVAKCLEYYDDYGDTRILGGESISNAILKLKRGEK